MNAFLNSPTVEEVGKLLFGSQHRLAIALWVYERHRDGTDNFYADQYTRDGGAYSSAIAKQIDNLVRLGMAVRCECQPDNRCVLYKWVDHPLWEIVHATGYALSVYDNRVIRPPRPAEDVLADLVALELELR